MNKHVLVLILAILAVAVTVWGQDIVQTVQDNVVRIYAQKPLPCAEALPCGFLSLNTVTVSTTVPTSVGTVPSGARRMLVQAGGKQYFSFNTTISNAYPFIATSSRQMFAGSEADLGAIRLLADSATSTALVFFFDE